jgi:hypothetical protein
MEGATGIAFPSVALLFWHFSTWIEMCWSRRYSGKARLPSNPMLIGYWKFTPGVISIIVGELAHGCDYERRRRRGMF